MLHINASDNSHGHGPWILLAFVVAFCLQDKMALLLFVPSFITTNQPSILSILSLDYIHFLLLRLYTVFEP